MICPPCKVAGRCVTRAKGEHDDAVISSLCDSAYWTHSDCEAPASCPCHHQVTLDALQTAL
jgi:hypothetical protein